LLNWVARAVPKVQYARNGPATFENQPLSLDFERIVIDYLIDHQTELVGTFGKIARFYSQKIRIMKVEIIDVLDPHILRALIKTSDMATNIVS